MRKQVVALLAGTVLMMATSTAMALTLNYSYSAFSSFPSWGTMDIDVVNDTTLSVLYTAASPLPSGTQATGFGFSFAGALASPTISNPNVANNDSLLTWSVFDKKNTTLPNITNRDDFNPVISNEYFFEMAADETRNTNMNPPGIAAGNKDVFYLNFTGSNFFASTFDLAAFIELTAVRLQGFDTLNDAGSRVDSLFLAGGPNTVPEPGTIVLLGAGLFGLGIFSRRRLNK